MEAVSALPASNSPFYKSQTVASIFYSVIFLIVSSVLLGISISIAFNERFTFSCKGVTQDYRKALCLEAYNNGPNDLQSWLYLTTFIGPLMIIVSMIILMLRKKYTLQKNNCTVHLHHLYFLKVSLRFLFHVLVCLALYIKLSIYRIGQLTLEGSYSCLIGSSTISCIDGKAKSKSYENIVCCLLHGFLVVFSLLELVYYSYKWRLSEEARNRQSSESTQCGECSYFIKTFNVFAGMSFTYFCFLDHIEIFHLVVLNIHAQMAAILSLVLYTLKYDISSNREQRAIMSTSSFKKLRMKCVYCMSNC